MRDLIRVLTLWAGLAFGLRGCGRHRARPAALPLPPADRAHSHLVPLPVAPRWEQPSPRSPYGMGGLDLLLNGEDTALVRPYLVEHDRRQERARQRRRRLALVLAAEYGIDLDQHLVGAEAVS